MRFYSVLVGPSTVSPVTWCWALLTLHPPRVPTSPSPSPWEASFTLTCYLFYQIFCLNTGGLSVSQEVEPFETQTPITHFSYLTLSGACLAEALGTEGPEVCRGRRVPWARPALQFAFQKYRPILSSEWRCWVWCGPQEVMRMRLGRKKMIQTPERWSPHATQDHAGRPSVARRQEDLGESLGQSLSWAFHGRGKQSRANDLGWASWKSFSGLWATGASLVAWHLALG